MKHAVGIDGAAALDAVGVRVGDPGSSTAGCKLLEEVLLAYDHVRPASDLTRRAMDMFDRDSRILADGVSNVAPARFAPMPIATDEIGDSAAGEPPAGGLGNGRAERANA